MQLILCGRGHGFHELAQIASFLETQDNASESALSKYNILRIFTPFLDLSQISYHFVCLQYH